MSLAKEAWPFVIVAAVLTAVVAWLSPVGAVVPGLLLLFVVWFFRDPTRVTPADPDLLVSPADGRIIRSDAESISIFMNVFNVHVCRTPAAGVVESVVHHPGRFLAAFKDEAPLENERTVIVVAEGKFRLEFTLIAGLIARRIVCRVRSGQKLERGQRVGLIRFGSRVDVALPEGTRPVVTIGDRVQAGETVIARSEADNPI